jgi:ATP-binding cassette subfamily C (CFTR/MRP) protein 1
MIRGALVGLIHNRSLTLKDGVYDESMAITLMSTDVDYITMNGSIVHEIWAQVIEVTIGVWLLAKLLGWACIVPLVVVARKCASYRTRPASPSNRCTKTYYFPLKSHIISSLGDSH